MNEIFSQRYTFLILAESQQNVLFPFGGLPHLPSTTAHPPHTRSIWEYWLNPKWATVPHLQLVNISMSCYCLYRLYLSVRCPHFCDCTYWCHLGNYNHTIVKKDKESEIRGKEEVDGHHIERLGAGACPTQDRPLYLIQDLSDPQGTRATQQRSLHTRLEQCKTEEVFTRTHIVRVRVHGFPEIWGLFSQSDIIYPYC